MRWIAKAQGPKKRVGQHDETNGFAKTVFYGILN